jgi:hypothetical protein
MEDRELTAWVEIASYLGVSVRTAQTWEKECGLPVRRLPGRQRVIVRTSELDAWKNGGGVSASPSETVSKRTGIRYTVTALAGLCVLAGLFAATAGARRSAPYAVTLSPTGFTVVDTEGRIQWSKTFPTRITTTGYCSGVRGVVADLDQDGANEVLFVACPEIDGPGNVPLICYRSDGTEWWRFTPGRPMRTTGASFTSEYKACGLTLLPPETGKVRIAVGSFHRLFFPYQVAFLSAEGRLVREYWHPGHLQAAALHDIDGDSRPELILGGVNNAHKQAALVALDPQSAHGVAREQNAGYQFLGLPLASETARVLFPRSAVSRGDVYNRASQIDADPAGVTVHVDELNTLRTATVFYRFGPSLVLSNVSLSDVFVKRTLELRADLSSEQARFLALTRY